MQFIAHRTSVACRVINQFILNAIASGARTKYTARRHIISRLTSINMLATVVLIAHSAATYWKHTCKCNDAADCFNLINVWPFVEMRPNGCPSFLVRCIYTLNNRPPQSRPTPPGKVIVANCGLPAGNTKIINQNLSPQTANIKLISRNVSLAPRIFASTSFGLVRFLRSAPSFMVPVIAPDHSAGGARVTVSQDAYAISMRRDKKHISEYSWQASQVRRQPAFDLIMFDLCVYN